MPNPIACYRSKPEFRRSSLGANCFVTNHPSFSSECFDASSSNLNINPSDDSKVRETSSVVDTTVICINPDASAEEPCCSTVSPQFNTTDVRPMPKAGPRKGTQKEKKKILTAPPVRKKLAEEEAKKLMIKRRSYSIVKKIIVSRMQN